MAHSQQDTVKPDAHSDMNVDRVGLPYTDHNFGAQNHKPLNITIPSQAHSTPTSINTYLLESPSQSIHLSIII